jgi:hypothetical protein
MTEPESRRLQQPNVAPTVRKPSSPPTAERELPQNWQSISAALARGDRISEKDVYQLLGPPDEIIDYGTFQLMSYKAGRSAGSVTLSEGTVKTVVHPSFRR